VVFGEYKTEVFHIISGLFSLEIFKIIFDKFNFTNANLPVFITFSAMNTYRTE